MKMSKNIVIRGAVKVSLSDRANIGISLTSPTFHKSVSCHHLRVHLRSETGNINNFLPLPSVSLVSQQILYSEVSTSSHLKREGISNIVGSSKGGQIEENYQHCRIVSRDVVIKITLNLHFSHN